MPGLGSTVIEGHADATVDLNADLGELPGKLGQATDAALLGIVTSASVAAGGHAGDRESMYRVCRLARERGVRIGAHLSFEDREGFGRRAPEQIDIALTATLTRQLAMLSDAADRAGTTVSYVKPHGALYNLALDDAQLAGALLDAMHDSHLPILTLSGSTLSAMASARGTATYGEFFADREYLPTGRLVPRDAPQAIVQDGVIERAVEAIVTKSVSAIDGTSLPVEFDSICVHGDTPDAVQLAAGIRHRIESMGLRIQAFTDASRFHGPTS